MKNCVVWNMKIVPSGFEVFSIFAWDLLVIVIFFPCCSSSLWLSQITQNQQPHIQNPPNIHPQRIPIKFPKNSKRIAWEVPKNCLSIHKKFWEFSLNSQKISKSEPPNNKSPKNIHKEFPQNFQKISQKISKNSL